MLIDSEKLKAILPLLVLFIYGLTAYWSIEFKENEKDKKAVLPPFLLSQTSAMQSKAPSHTVK